ncbi:MAG: HEPN domain-containing protein [Phycisphaerae bacterium]
MPLTPLQTLENGIERATYLVDLYELLHNQRQRRVRSDWAEPFRQLMHWNQSDQIERIDGDGCMLILKNPTDWTMQHFEHEHLSELLRAAHICAVSAMDRFFHDLLIDNVLGLLRRNVDDVPSRLANFALPLADAEAAIDHALRSRRDGTASRPRTTLKQRFTNAIHRCTFQSPAEIEEAFRMLGIRNIWGKLGQRMAGRAEELKSRLNQIVHRRNQIVHEGDVRRADRPQAVNLNDITADDTRADIEWLKGLAEAAGRVVQDEL